MNCPDKGLSNGDAVAIVAINRDVITRESALNQAHEYQWARILDDSARISFPAREVSRVARRQHENVSL